MTGRHLAGLLLAALPLIAGAQTRTVDDLIREARAARAAGDRFAALRAYGEVRRLDPQHPGLGDAMADVLRQLGAPYAAADVHQSTFALQAHQAALRVRWGEQIWSRDPAQRFTGTDAALAEIDRLLVAAAAGGVPADAVLQLRRDRVVALRQRERWTEVVAATARMRDENHPLPAYVRHAEADALLALRRPEEARNAYKEVLQADPANRDARIGLFYSEVECEDFDAAFATVDRLAAEGQPFRGPAPGTPDVDWFDARILAAMARSYADMQAEAWSRLKPLADAAPAVAYLRNNVASVAAARGWARKAEEETLIAASLAPDDRGIQVSLGESALRTRDWPGARRRAEALMKEAPGDAAVQRLDRDVRLHGMNELRVELTGRRETGGSNAAPGDGYDFISRLYSRPIAEHWRLLAGAEHHSARPVEGYVLRNRTGLGAEYRVRDVTIEGIVWNNTGTLSRDGARASGEWNLSDHWSLGAEAERFAADVPLRALYYGTTADAVGMSAGYAWHESRSVYAGIRRLDFSDGNERTMGRVAYAEKIVDRPGLDVTLRPEVYASENTLRTAPYFNPVNDLSYALGVDIEHVLSRFYERSLTQRLVLTAAGYKQSGYASAPTGSVRYEQVWRPDVYTEVRYGVESAHRVYDGAGLTAWTGFVTLGYRFR